MHIHQAFHIFVFVCIVFCFLDNVSADCEACIKGNQYEGSCSLIHKESECWGNGRCCADSSWDCCDLRVDILMLFALTFACFILGVLFAACYVCDTCRWHRMAKKACSCFERKIDEQEQNLRDQGQPLVFTKGKLVGGATPSIKSKVSNSGSKKSKIESSKSGVSSKSLSKFSSKSSSSGGSQV
mmetsp:Transcript_20001/g.27689  ORF Transcript_20001/g.27689 Transcript_20001/m.27689 type:complete len:184 (+) Transcript_20001:34-585(+)